MGRSGEGVNKKGGGEVGGGDNILPHLLPPLPIFSNSLAVSFPSRSFGIERLLRRLESDRRILQTFLQLTTSMARRKCRIAFW